MSAASQSRPKPQCRRRLVFSTAGVFTVLVGSGAPAWAAVDFNPFATVSIQHNSNVFARAEDQPPFSNLGNTALGDTIEQYTAGANAIFAFGRDSLTLSAQGSKFDFNRFDTLNHYEGKFGGLLLFHLGTGVEGDFNYLQSRQMASLADTLAQQLEIQNEKKASAELKFRLNPRWRFNVAPSWHDFESPLPQYPLFGYTERAGAGQLEYQTTQKFSAGLREEYLKGDFHDIAAATRYHQTNTQLTANYAVTGFSTFDGNVGYSRRQDELINPGDVNAPAVGGKGVGTTSALTGALGYNRRLSSKTSFDLRIFRQVESYVAGANSEISTGAEGGVKWDPDMRFSISMRYRYSTQSIQGALITANFFGRVDHTRDALLNVEYRPFFWLTVRPYVIRQDRSSNFHEANFNATVVGIDFTARRSQPLK